MKETVQKRINNNVSGLELVGWILLCLVIIAADIAVSAAICAWLYIVIVGAIGVAFVGFSTAFPVAVLAVVILRVLRAVL